MKLFQKVVMYSGRTSRTKRTNPIVSKVNGTLTCEVFPRERGRYEVVCSLVKPTGEVTFASHGVLPNREAAVEVAREVARSMKRNPIRYVDGWQYGTIGKVYPRREQALAQMRAIHFARGRRNPKITKKIGNIFGGMGVLTILLIAGLIIWVRGRSKE